MRRFAEIRKYLVAYLVWAASAVIWALPLLLGPQLIAGAMEFSEFSRWTISAFQRFGFVLLGLAWLVAVIFAEHYLRTSATRQRLPRALIRVGVANLIVVVLLLLPALPLFL